MYTCQKCQKQFLTKDALNAHCGVHNGSYETRLIKLKEGKLKKSLNKEIEYNKNPKLCKECNKPICISLRLVNKFCSSSCAGRYNGKKRHQSDETKKKISNRLSGRTLTLEVKQRISMGCIGRHKKAVLVTWVCPVCNKELKLHSYDAKHRKYCSGTCRNKINNLKQCGNRSKAEIKLGGILKSTFPSLTILTNDRTCLGGLELDFYIPELKVAIEWNGIYHCKPIHGNDKLNRVIERDLTKKRMCDTLGIHLIIIEDKTSHNKFIDQQINLIIEKVKSYEKLY